jgi:hypothetical protein
VDCIDEDGHQDYRSYSAGVPLPITSVVDVSDSFISITLSNRIVLIDVARKDVIIV